MKLKLVALTLIAFACWLLPIKTLAQEIGTQPHAQTNPQALPEVHDQSGTQNVAADPSERRQEDEAGGSKEARPVITPASEDTRTQITSRTRPLNRTSSRTSAGRDSGRYNGQSYSKEEVQQLIKDYSAQYGISADLPLRIANCESGFNQFSKNKSSTASGVFQYLASTWKATDQGKVGLSVFNADANVKAAVSYIASRGNANPWNASRSCWNK